MVICVSGTQNIGKSTFIKDFVETYPDFITPEVDYRGLIASNNLKINREGDARSQKVLFDFIVNDVKSQKGNVILDRSCIDACVYSLWHYLNRPVESGFTHDEIRYQYEVMRETIKIYDKIFFIPLRLNPGIKLVDDGVRDIDEKYRAEIDRLFETTFISFGEKFYKEKVVEVYGNREERKTRFLW